MEQKANLTIDDIARELGVSKTTVSRAISGKGRISAATRARVRECIERHNYRPSAAARGLAENRTFNLALVIPHSFLGLDLPFVRQSMSAICEEAFEHNYNVMVCLSTGSESDPLVRTLDQRKVDGVIVSRTIENDPLIDLLISRGIPFATLGSLPQKYQGMASVEADHSQAQGCFTFTAQLLAAYPDHAALLGNDLSYVVNQSRLTGFVQACKELGRSLEQTPIRVNLGTQEAVSQAVEELLHQGIRKFLCMDDDICVQTLVALSQLKDCGGAEAEAASFCDSSLLQNHVPPVSALSFDAAELGRTACRELLKCIRGEPFDPAPLLGYKICMR